MFCRSTRHRVVNYLVFGLCPSSDILKTRKHNVPETGSVSVPQVRGKTLIQLGPLERANLSHWTRTQMGPLERVLSKGSN
jgi:hypothetical protein